MGCDLGEMVGAEEIKVLVAALQAGDRGAWQVVNTNWVPPLERMLSKRNVQPADVEDIVQNSLLKLFGYKDTLDASKNPKALFLRIGVRTAIDWYRKKIRMPMFPLSGSESSRMSDPEAYFLEGAYDLAVQLLTDDELRLHAATRTKRQTDIAFELGVTEGAISKRIAKVNQRIEAIVADLLDPCEPPGRPT